MRYPKRKFLLLSRENIFFNHKNTEKLSIRGKKSVSKACLKLLLFFYFRNVLQNSESWIKKITQEQNTNIIYQIILYQYILTFLQNIHNIIMDVHLLIIKQRHMKYIYVLWEDICFFRQILFEKLKKISLALQQNF